MPRNAIRYERVCEVCGVTFRCSKQAATTPGWGRFCSRACKDAYKNPEARYWSFVEIRGLDECWPWRDGAARVGEYGVFWTGEVLTTAHRYGLSLKLKKPLSELAPHTLHSCDNRPCQNPTHLSEGTAADNLEDMRLKGRRKRTGPPGGSLNEEAVRTIRQRYAAGNISQSALAAEFGADQTVVSQVVLRKIWRHVT